MPHQGNEDWDLWIGRRSPWPGVILDVLFFYRRRPGSLCDGDPRRPHLDPLMHIVQASTKPAIGPTWPRCQGEGRRSAGLTRANTALEAGVSGAHPHVERLRDELATLKGDSKRPRPHPTRAAYQAATAEARALRASASWRVTAPLRAVYEVLRGSARRPMSSPSPD